MKFWNLRVTRMASALIKTNPNLSMEEARLFCAAHEGYFEYLKVCLEKASPNSKIFYGLRGEKYITPLHFAALSGNINCVKLLMEHGARIQMPTKKYSYFTSPLHYGAASGSPACVSFFLDLGLPVNLHSSFAVTPGLENFGVPIEIAVFHGRYKVCELLISKGAWVQRNAVDDIEPVHWAARGGHAKCLQLLIESGASAEACTEYDGDALYMAVERGFVDCVKVLLNAKVDPGFTGSFMDDRTPLELAVAKNHINVVKVLLEFNPALVNDEFFPKKWGRKTAVHIAVLQSNIEILKLLLSYYPDCTLKDREGKTALDLARTNGNNECERLLEEYKIEREFYEDYYAEINDEYESSSIVISKNKFICP